MRLTAELRTHACKFNICWRHTQWKAAINLQTSWKDGSSNWKWTSRKKTPHVSSRTYPTTPSLLCFNLVRQSLYSLYTLYRSVVQGYNFPLYCIYPPPPLIPSVNTKWIHNAPSIRYPLQNFLSIWTTYLNGFNVFLRLIKNGVYI